MQTKQLIRRQHPKFGDEIRELLRSDRSEDKERAGIIVSELDSLTRLRSNGQRHSKEERLSGAMSEIEYLKLYPHGYSIRVYYHVSNGVIWILAVDSNKRATAISKSTLQLLSQRLKYVQTLDKEGATNNGPTG